MNPTKWTNGQGDAFWTCGACGIGYRSPFMDRPAETQATDCCRCVADGCAEQRDRNYTMCPEHLTVDRHRRATEMLEKERALPLVAPADVPGMVYDPSAGYWHTDLDEAVDALWCDDEDRDWSTTIVHPGRETRAAVPCLVDVVTEAIAEQYDDDGWDHMPGDVEAVLKAVDEWLGEKAPVMWEANTRVRVDMVAALADFNARGVSLDPERVA